MIHNDPARDPELERAYAALPRARAPSPDFTDRVLHDLSARGLVERPAVRAHWLAAAVAIFAAGTATGLGAGMLIAAKRAPIAPATASASNASSQINLPNVGRSEAWF